MEREKAATGDVILRLATPVVIWALTKLVESDTVQQRLRKVDRKAERKASGGTVYVAAGAAALLVGVGLIAAGAKKR